MASWWAPPRNVKPKLPPSFSNVTPTVLHITENVVWAAGRKNKKQTSFSTHTGESSLRMTGYTLNLLEAGHGLSQASVKGATKYELS